MNFCSYGCGRESKFKLKNNKSCCSKIHTLCPSFQSKVTYAKKIETNELCSYGCGQQAAFIFGKSNKLCCCERLQSCPSIRKKNSDTNKIKQSGSNNAMYGKKHSLQSIEKNRKSNKKLWKDPNSIFNSKEWRENLSKAVNIRPNKPETIINDILFNLYPNKFIYTGNFSKWIGRKNPDFISEDDKLIIEHFGNYYHSEEFTGENKKIHENKRIEYFKSYGYDTLIIWESQLYNNIDQCIENIKKFCERTL